MAESDFLTTKSTVWSRDKTPFPPWNKAGVLDKEFGENEKVPLEFINSIACLSRGGVVEQRRTEDGMLVAVKKMDTYGKADINEELRREVEILRSLKHYHSVSLLGTFIQGDCFNIVMEPCATCDLYTFLSQPLSTGFKNITAHHGPQEFFLPKIMGCLAHGLQYNRVFFKLMATPEFRRDSHQIVIYYMIRYYRNE